MNKEEYLKRLAQLLEVSLANVNDSDPEYKLFNENYTYTDGVRRTIRSVLLEIGNERLNDILKKYENKQKMADNERNLSQVLSN